ncbi:hypothetical protein [Pedobacter mucosus]|uniref:hypothetical protein n=1 Tax=Pedobacter mucosus TaxID=2895286 RepID=UPI001EE4AEB5|nr:hypothetical protein [Pedobacter mucosus]UKT64599.1 hypothetical protein LOK61_02195 [Pedobacter mucosus]
MEKQHLLSYAIVFLCGALASYLIQKIIGRGSESERSSHPNTMDPKIIQQMVDDYRNNQLAVINKTLGLNDAHSVSFALKTLKKFITDIEDQTKKRDSNIGIDELGIRFYYAAYPKADDWRDLENEKSIEKDQAQKHTVIMIPTLKKEIDKGSKLEYDFNPLDRDTFYIKERNDRPVTLMAMSDEGGKGPTRQVMAQNHGQTIPPADAVVENY